MLLLLNCVNKIMKKLLLSLSAALLLVILLPNSALAASKFPGDPCIPGTDTCDGGGVVTNYVCSPTTNRCDPQSLNNSLIYTPRSASEVHVRGSVGPDGKQKSKGTTAAFIDSIGDQGSSTVGGGGQIASLMTAMYLNKPASLPQYIADVKKNMGIPGVQDAYAQGYGYQSLLPIQDLWKLMRNIALAGFVVVFVIIGIMIMLRSKIDPRTVISIQQAVPKLVISLILVVFSFAICGVAIDFMTVLTRVGASVLQSSGYIARTSLYPDGQANPALLDRLLSQNIFGLFSELYNTEKLYEGITNLPPDFLGPLSVIFQVESLVGQSGLTRTVVVIALFIAVLRTFFVLLEAYVKVTLTVIISPLQMLVLAIPGQGKGFGDWFRGLMANLLIFPVVFLLIALAAILNSTSLPPSVPAYGTAAYLNYLTNINSSTAYYNKDGVWGVGRFVFDKGNYWSPPALGDWSSMAGPLLAIGILLTLPKVAGSVREAIHPAYKAGAGDGEASKGLQSAAQRIPVVGSMLR